jgi:hypothetical protein
VPSDYPNRSLSVIEIFQQLSTGCFQNENRAESNCPAYDCRPEDETAEAWHYAVRKKPFVGAQHVITASEAQPFDSVSS